MVLLDYFGGFLLDFWKNGQNLQIWAISGSYVAA